MNEISNLWNIILESNTFNFVVLLVILVAVMQKLHISDTLEGIKQEIIQKIEKAKQAKSDAQQYLIDAKSKNEHLQEEVAQKLALANNQAHNVGEMIRETAQKKIKQLSDNVEKVIEAEEKTLAITLNDNTVQASVKLAQDIILDKLAKNPELHEKYINESIENIEKVQL